MSKVSCAMLNKNGESGHPCLIPDLRGKAFSFLPLSIMLVVGLLCMTYYVEVVVVVQSLSCIQPFATPWTAACHSYLSITNSWSLIKLMSIESVMPSNHHPLSSLSSPDFSLSSIRVFPNESVASGGQSIGVSASASVLPMNTEDWSPLGWTGWISLQFKGLTRVFSSTTVQKQFFDTQLSSQSNSHIHTWPLEKP